MMRPFSLYDRLAGRGLRSDAEIHRFATVGPLNPIEQIPPPLRQAYGMLCVLDSESLLI